MLKQVGETSAADLFILRSDVVPKLEIDHGRGVVFVCDNCKPVRESGLFVLQRFRGRLWGLQEEEGDQNFCGKTHLFLPMKDFFKS